MRTWSRMSGVCWLRPAQPLRSGWGIAAMWWWEAGSRVTTYRSARSAGTSRSAVPNQGGTMAAYGHSVDGSSIGGHNVQISEAGRDVNVAVGMGSGTLQHPAQVRAEEGTNNLPRPPAEVFVGREQALEGLGR